MSPVVNDYRCFECGSECDFEEAEEFIWATCSTCDYKQTEWHRLYRPPRLGGMSSGGTPPR